MKPLYRIQQIEIEGFRGYPRKATFNFDNKDLVLIYGSNRTGKSSLMNAMDWCFYGDDITKEKKTNIRERIDWEATNFLATEPAVRFILKDIANKCLEVYRKGKKTFEIKKDGILLKDNDVVAEIKASLADFYAGVHLHQEAIRNFIIATPSAKQDALLRILGLSAISDIKELVASQKMAIKLEKESEILKERIQEMQKIHKENIEHTKSDLSHIKEDSFSDSGIAKICSDIATELESIAQNAGLPVPVLETYDTRSNRQKFLKELDTIITNFRSAHPSTKRFSEIAKELQNCEIVKGKVQSLKDEEKNISNKINDLLQKYGDTGQVSKTKDKLEADIRTKKQERTAKNSLSGVISEAKSYIESTKELTKCPVCEQNISRDTLLEHLSQVHNSMDVETKSIDQVIRQMENDIKIYEAVLKNYRDIEVQNRQLLIAKEDLKKNVETLIGKTLLPESDLFVEVNQKINSLSDEKNVLKKKTDEINVILDNLLKRKQDIQNIQRVLDWKTEIDKLNEATKSKEWNDLNEIIMKAETLDRQLEIINEAVNNTITEIVEDNLNKVKTDISQIFAKITKRSDYPNLTLDTERFDLLASNNQEERKAIPFFNQGDLNAAAIAIFLALAKSEPQHNIGFILLDDPSQSLHSEYKQAFAEILNDIVATRQVVVSTMDTEFKQYCLEKVAKEKRCYELIARPNDNPDIKIEV